MRKRIQAILWLFLFLWYYLNLSLFKYDNLFVPQMFVYYDWQCLCLYPGTAYNIMFPLFVTTGIMTLLLGPAILLGFPKIFSHEFFSKYVFWNLIMITAYCFVDICGCIFFVPGQYHFPAFSVIIDCFVIALSIWSIHTTTRSSTWEDKEDVSIPELH